MRAPCLVHAAPSQQGLWGYRSQLGILWCLCTVKDQLCSHSAALGAISLSCLQRIWSPLPARRWLKVRMTLVAQARLELAGTFQAGKREQVRAAEARRCESAAVKSHWMEQQLWGWTPAPASPHLGSLCPGHDGGQAGPGLWMWNGEDKAGRRQPGRVIFGPAPPSPLLAWGLASKVTLGTEPPLSHRSGGSVLLHRLVAACPPPPPAQAVSVCLPGSYFANHFIMGGEKFDSTHPEGYLFGENSDLNFLGNRPVVVGTGGSGAGGDTGLRDGHDSQVCPLPKWSLRGG